MLLKNILLTCLYSFLFSGLNAQPDRWQQRVEYTMDIDFEVKNHQFNGKQQLRYFNNSPDTLDRVFYHLYFNAFQPNSMMDVRSRTLSDPDGRVKDRILNLKEHEMGWHRINSLTMNGMPCRFEVNETILEVSLPQPLLPHSSAVFSMEFRSQVPVQIRRSGRDSRDGIAYTMTQWYPKMCEYDYQGWHANPYVAREFYGVWGDFNVNISIDKNYVLGASGVLQNGGEIGHGYEPKGTAVKWGREEKLTWQWKAENVHDFAWAADPDYKHVTLERPDGLTLHFLYEENDKTRKTWQAAPAAMNRAFDYINEHFGKYPYSSYAFIEGGDGGMEYPMATMLSGSAGMGTFVHELMHAWYYGLLGTNESLYAWMDEGFTEYATDEVMNVLMEEKLADGTPVEKLHLDANDIYIKLMLSGNTEPLSTHADHFNTNRTYSISAYVHGHVLLTELQYIIGKPAFDKGMLRYFNEWKHKHPNPNDFIRVMEKTAGLELDWFKEYFVYSLKTIDYTVAQVEKANRKQTRIVLKNNGKMPMPIDLEVTYKNGEKEVFNIPQSIMRGSKSNEFGTMKYTILPDWHWTHPTYELLLDEKFRKVVRVQIDPSMRMADTAPENNFWQKNEENESKEDEDEKD